MNALLKKEIRTRMRGKTIFIIENVYLVLLTGIFLLVLFISFASDRRFAWEVGKGLFNTVNYFQILLLVVASPTIVASTFTLEREQKTLDMLLATPLSLGQIARAKLLASLSIFFVLVLVSLPMLSVCFILGGASPGEIFWAYFLTVEGVLLAGVIGLCFSAYFKRTLAAVPVSSLTIIVFLIATYFISWFLSPAIALLNPLYAFRLMISDWTTKFFVFQIPFWLPSLILTTLLFLSVFTYTIEILKEEKRRASVWPKVLLLSFYSSVLIFLLGSTIETGPDFAKVVMGLTRFVYPLFLFCVVQAIVVSGGVLTTLERKKLFLSWNERYVRPHGWFGPGLLTGPRFSLLVAFAGIVVFAFGVLQIQMLESKGQSVLLTGGLLVVCTLTYAMLTRLFSLVRRTQGKSLPHILASLCFFAAIFLPHLASYIQRRGTIEIPETAWDIFIFASPLFALGSVLEPSGALESYPYCEALLSGIPFSLITILVYIPLLAIIWIFNLLCERKIRASEQAG